jgi:hypothetical protein
MLPNCLIGQQIFTKNFVHSKNLIKWKVLVKHENTLVEVLDFLMGCESFLRKRRISVQVGATLVSSLSCLFVCII